MLTGFRFNAIKTSSYCEAKKLDGDGSHRYLTNPFQYSFRSGFVQLPSFTARNAAPAPTITAGSSPAFGLSYLSLTSLYTTHLASRRGLFRRRLHQPPADARPQLLTTINRRGCHGNCQSPCPHHCAYLLRRRANSRH